MLYAFLGRLGLCAAAALVAASPARAQTETEEATREDFQAFYKRQQTEARSFFGSAPNHHITPRRDNITFSLQFDTYDVTVAPKSDDQPDDFSTLDERLEMTGWSAFPLVAFSADRFGVGFTGDAGARQVKFLSRVPDSATFPGSYFEQYSDMSYTGAGLYGFMLLRSNALPKWLSGTLILGGRQLTAVHLTRGTRTDSQNVPEEEKLKYDVTVADAGLNVAAQLAKRFVVFPWVNYRRSFLGALEDRNGEELDTALVDPSVALDRQLAWTSQPDLTYGIDFAVQLASFDIHFGGLFGYVAALNRGADRVQDKSLSIGASYALKSR